MTVMARLGDTISCGDIIAEGCKTVFIDNLPVVLQGCKTTGHDLFPPSAISGPCTSTCFINDIPVALDGISSINPHKKRRTPLHAGTATCSGGCSGACEAPPGPPPTNLKPAKEVETIQKARNPFVPTLESEIMKNFQPDRTPTIEQFSITRSRIVAGGTFFRSKEMGQSANRICVEFNNGEFKVIKFQKIFNADVRKYDGVSKIEFTGTNILVNDVVVSSGNEIKTSSNYIIFSSPLVINPIVETYQVLALPPESTESGFSIADLRSKIQNSNIIEMPIRPEGDVVTEGVDGASITTFGRVFLKGGGGLPEDASGAYTGPFRTFVMVSFKEGPDGTKNPVQEMYDWVGPSKTEGYWQQN